jgi:hypothetical protein
MFLSFKKRGVKAFEYTGVTVSGIPSCHAILMNIGA